MTLYVISDTHFGHNKMHDYCGRPVGFEETILSNISHTCRLDDVLIHLGDVCIYKDEYWHEKLMDARDCKKWLIKGNHDRKSNTWYLEHGWDFVADEIKFDMFGKILLLSHAPVLDRTDFDINIHGHLHNTLDRPERLEGLTDRHRLIMCEHDYRPVQLRRVVEVKP